MAGDRPFCASVGFFRRLCYALRPCAKRISVVVRSGVIHLFRVAVLTTLLVGSGLAWAQTIGMAVNSRGNEVDSQRVDALWRIDLQTGEAEYVGWTSYLDLEGLAFDAEGALLGADDDTKTLVRVSQTSGLAIPVGGQVNRSNMGVSLSDNLDFGLAVGCQNRAWVVSSSEQTLFEADLETGELTVVGEPGSLGAPISDLAIRGNLAYGIGVGLNADGSTAAPNLYSIDLGNGRSTVIGPLGAAALPYNNAGLDFDASGKLWAVTDRRAVPGGDFPSAILRIDPATGLAERVAETIVGLESLAISPTSGCLQGGPGPALGVPMLSIPGLIVLVLVLLGVGGVQIRSRLG
ncbi:hypothetical protein AY599_01720 [Leptolyngbya valderiana BDU 20041]|nr:hypothetical protein AY599_01720 [Leptolyngbya valderiana BDU 20041]